MIKVLILFPLYNQLTKKMKILLMLTSIFCANIISLGQWFNLGVHEANVQMIEDNVGYQFSNNSGSTPAAGIVNSISFTQDDWQMETIVNTGGGTYWGCCPISNLHFLDSDVGLRSEGFQGVYSFQKTIDGGVNWSNLPGSMVFRPTDVCLINDSVAYVAGNFYGPPFAKLYRLTPSSFTQIFAGDTMSFHANYTDNRGNMGNIEFVNSDIGFIIVKDTNQISYLFKTIDSGVSWNIMFTDSINELTSVSFPNGLIGYVSSTNGKVYKSTDGGDNWIGTHPSTIQDINSIDFIDDTIGYAVCNSGQIYRTINGGVTWDEEVSGLASNIIKVKIIDINAAYCIDENGTLLKNKFILSITEEENHEQSFLVFPNPAHQTIDISILNNSIIDDVYIYDQIGSLVSSGKKNQIDISNLLSGIYFILIKSEDQYLYSKFIKN